MVRREKDLTPASFKAAVEELMERGAAFKVKQAEFDGRIAEGKILSAIASAFN